MENNWITYLDDILSKYNIKYQKVNNVIDSSNHNDFRLNIIVDNKYIVRINNKNVITKERLCEIDRLITRYNDIGVYVPHYIKNNSGVYSINN